MPHQLVLLSEGDVVNSYQVYHAFGHINHHLPRLKGAVTPEKIAEPLDVFYASLKEKCKNKENGMKRGLIEVDDVAEWLVGPTEGEEAQVHATYGMRCLLQCVVVKRTPYYLVDWERTLEPTENLTKDLVALSNRERCVLVRKTLIEDEEVVDNSLDDSSDAYTEKTKA
ncbi:unnamed protein product [Phytophthora fragariaefolia]|uniref:Unnamed protein product n=1 Tax=Phytophthora fragariaefolia TaxID=1490495 RepID=A0A9W7CRT0_9STRA|nr:unnamed protein product [Phytophthora fragariaefolia]